jgi:hypothetical protein
MKALLHRRANVARKLESVNREIVAAENALKQIKSRLALVVQNKRNAA